MSAASVAVAEKSVPQTIGALWFFFTDYRLSTVQEFLTGRKTSSDLFVSESIVGYQQNGLYRFLPISKLVVVWKTKKHLSRQCSQTDAGLISYLHI